MSPHPPGAGSYVCPDIAAAGCSAGGLDREDLSGVGVAIRLGDPVGSRLQLASGSSAAAQRLLLQFSDDGKVRNTGLDSPVMFTWMVKKILSS